MSGGVAISRTVGRRLQSTIFVLLLCAVLGLLAALTSRFALQADWSYGARNSLSAPSRALLTRLDRGRVTIEAFTRAEGPTADTVRDLVKRYLRAGAPFDLSFVNPELAPDRVRALGINADGALRVSYDGRAETLQRLNESALSNLLLRLVRGGERRLLFLTGHGERRADGQANHDLGRFGEALVREGLRVDPLLLGEMPAVPADAALLIIASPQVALFAGEVAVIERYIDAGGNLLWLDEPDATSGLAALAARFGVSRLPGVVVDATARAYGIDDPSFAMVTAYPSHAATDGLVAVALFPKAAALEVDAPDGWSVTRLLTTQPGAWNETGSLDGTLVQEVARGERAGPLTLGVVLQRPRPGAAGEQRVAVLGDGDFLTNAYLGNGGNLALGMRLVNWLVNDDALIDIPPRIAPDRQLQLGRTASMVIGFGFLGALPLALLTGGMLQWRRRRRG